MDLLNKRCVSCEGGTPSFTKTQAEEYLKETSGLILKSDGKSISREFSFGDFNESIAFINKVADLAEAESHHPDIYIFYNRVKLELSTHAIGGLSENDYILAAKINQILK